MYLKIPPALREELTLPDSRYSWKNEDLGYYLSILDNDRVGVTDCCEVARITFDMAGDTAWYTLTWFGFFVNGRLDQRPRQHNVASVEEACRLAHTLFLLGE